VSFDDIIDRSEYPALKWTKAQLAEHFGNDGALPFWVADMDFRAPDVLVESLLGRAGHGIYGYECRTDGYFEALVQWYEHRHGWSIDLDHLEFCPGVLNGIAIVLNQHSERGDGVIVQPPVFFEFRTVIRANRRRMIKNPLKVVDGQFQMDFEDLEEKAADPKSKIMIICNPHNPVGRVWTQEEQAQAGEICRKHNVLVISDEIHGDIVYKPHRYTPFASISDELAQASVACISPGKTFNLSGVVDSMAVIANEEYRKQFHDFAHRYQINRTNVFASAATEVAYSQGGEWLDELLAYLQANIGFLRAYLRDNLPQVKLVEPEGTFMVWLDFRELGLGAKELARFLAEQAGLALNPGHWFGREGAGYARMNIACPQSLLQEAMLRLTSAVRNHLGAAAP
jgi:cystathionine beta-lyase